MNQQSESADLLGGFKPVDLKFLIFPIREEFKILERSYLRDRKWLTLVKAMKNITIKQLAKLELEVQNSKNEEDNITIKKKN